MNTTALNLPFVWLEADDYAEPHNAGRPFTICNAVGDDVATIYSADDATVDVTRAQAIATARLFAAAPAMLDVLREVQFTLSPHGRLGGLVDEVIRNATGRKPPVSQAAE